jgi:hypothetical protein
VAGLTLDAGALIAYERGHDAKDARVARLARASSIELLDEQIARAAASLRRAIPGANTIDACIAVGARRRGDARHLRSR